MICDRGLWFEKQKLRKVFCWIQISEMFCTKCRYNLRRLESSVCPECGAPFDKNDPTTFSRKSNALVIDPSRRKKLYAVHAIFGAICAAILACFLPIWMVWYIGIYDTNADQGYILEAFSGVRRHPPRSLGHFWFLYSSTIIDLILLIACGCVAGVLICRVRLWRADKSAL